MPNIEKLLQWYDINHRILPWRSTSDPYKIWLSEIILQQTRVDQGLNYYLKFIDKFPAIEDLAHAGEDEILKLWQGLGYYSRARNLHKTAKTVCHQHGGIFPKTYHEILKLKGVGPYTAAAIASIVFDEPKPVVDGNVMRLVSRWYAIDEAVNSASGINQIKEILTQLIDKNQPGKFNQAMMEFGAGFCKPKNPDCFQCIFKDQCLAFQKNKVAILPRKNSTVKVKNRYFNYLFINFIQDGEIFTFLKKRQENDIWKGLYEFPLIETLHETGIMELLRNNEEMIPGSPDQLVIESISKKYLHKLTHQRINSCFIKMEFNGLPGENSYLYLKIPLTTIRTYPVSRLTDKYLNDCGL